MVPTGVKRLARFAVDNQNPPLSYRLTSGFISMMPHRALFHASRAGGFLHFLMAWSKRRCYLDNIPRAARRSSGCRPWNAFQNHTLNVLEMLKAPSESPEMIMKRVSIFGAEVLDRAAALRQGLIVVTIHSGNWELSGLALALKGYPITTIAGEQLNAGWSEPVKDWKRRYGIKVISRDRSMRDLYRDLEGGRFVVLHLDGDVFNGGFEVDFLGKRSQLPRGPAHLSRVAKVPVCFAVCRRRDRHRLEIQLHDPLPAPGSPEAELEFTQKLARIIENSILAEPGQWCIFRQL
jgi:lauroyl/myristoyl acyltransferase